MNKKELQQLLIVSMVSAAVCQIYASMEELPIDELPDEMREKCESLREHADEVWCYFGEFLCQKANQIFDGEELNNETVSLLSNDV